MVKDGVVDFLKNFEKKFKEIRIEGYRKDASSASVMFTEDMCEDLPEAHYTEIKLKEIKTKYMGTESEAQKRYQNQISGS